MTQRNYLRQDPRPDLPFADDGSRWEDVAVFWCIIGMALMLVLL